MYVPEAINRVWPMDFMSDTLEDGRSFRAFNVIDDYNQRRAEYRRCPVVAQPESYSLSGADYRMAMKT